MRVNISAKKYIVMMIFLKIYSFLKKRLQVTPFLVAVWKPRETQEIIYLPPAAGTFLLLQILLDAFMIKTLFEDANN